MLIARRRQFDELTVPALTTLPSVGLDLSNSSSLQARQTHSSGLPYSFEWDNRSGRECFRIGHSSEKGAKGAVVRNTKINLASETGGRSLAGSGAFLIDDPQSAGFVPAFVVGNLHMTKLPARACSPHAEDAAVVQESVPLFIPPQAATPPKGLAAMPRLILYSLAKATGQLGSPSGLMGLFAEKRSAELVAMQNFAEYRALPQAKSQDWNTAIDAQQLLDPWPDAYPPESTPLESTPPSNDWQKRRALHDDKQVDESDDVKFRKSMTVVRFLEQAMFSALDAARCSGNKVKEQLLAKDITVTSTALTESLCYIQEHPALCPAVLDHTDKAVADAETASREQMSAWQGDDAVNKSLRRGLLAYTIPGIWLEMPSLVGPLRFTPAFTNHHTATMAWRCLNLSGTPLLQQQPLQTIIAAAQEHNKPKLGALAAAFKSVASTAASSDAASQRMSLLWQADVPAYMPAMEMIGCRLGPYHVRPMAEALRTMASNMIRSAFAEGAQVLHEDWTETVRFPAQVPVLPHGWPDSHVDSDTPQTYATVQFDKAVASGQRAPEAYEAPGAQGLLVIGDIGFEDHETPSDFQQHPEAKLEVKINFQNVVGVAKYL